MAARWAQRTRPCAGETANGDLALVLSDGARDAFVVIDGLGHGPRAQAAAEAAAAALERAALADGLEALFAAVHQALRGTRGAAMTIVLREGSRLRAAGVGNVAMRLVPPGSLALVPTDGVLGARARTLRVAEGSATSGRLVLHSDGISHRFDPALVTAGSLEEACERVLADHGVPHDDATVLIAAL
jgi:hypothetical protein